MKKKQAGFSLFELIVVIGIITILSGGVLYNFIKLQRKSALETTLTNVRDKMTQARGEVRKGKCQVMDFNFDNANHKLVMDCKKPKEYNSATIDIPSDTTMNPASATFTLTNNGLGGLSVVINSPINLSFSKQGETMPVPPLVLDQTKILYGPF